MPNVLDREPMRALARRASGKITDEKIAQRFERLAFRHLLEDPRNFRPARQDEIEAAPDWARAALARGEDICVFQLNRSAANRVHTVARRLAHTCEIAHATLADNQGYAAEFCAARRFLAKFDRVCFDAAAVKALYYSRLRGALCANQDATEVCERQTLPASMGRSWERVVSVAQLRKTGREFHNCLAQAVRSSSYAAMLRGGIAQFWVLRGSDGAGLAVAMASLLRMAEFHEVKGPRNARINLDHPDLVLLGRAIGIGRYNPRPRPPPPPTPPPTSAAALTRPAPRGGSEIDLMRERLRLLHLLRAPLRRQA